jgi:plastocyanin
MGSTGRAYIALVVIAVAVALAMTGCSTSTTTGTDGAGTSGTGTSAGGTTIVEQNFAFNPSTVTVAVGDTVTFSNQDTVPHHVFVGTTDLGVQQPGATVTWSADKDGTFGVQCMIHASMTGQITVGKGGPIAAAPAPPAGGAPGAAPGGGYSY